VSGRFLVSLLDRLPSGDNVGLLLGITSVEVSEFCDIRGSSGKGSSSRKRNWFVFVSSIAKLLGASVFLLRIFVMLRSSRGM